MGLESLCRCRFECVRSSVQHNSADVGVCTRSTSPVSSFHSPGTNTAMEAHACGRAGKLEATAATATSGTHKDHPGSCHECAWCSRGACNANLAAFARQISLFIIIAWIRPRVARGKEKKG